MGAQAPADLLQRYRRAKERRAAWESHWQECYDFALPQRGMFPNRPGERKGDRLFDGTAPDAVDQLAASLMSHVTPPWSRWFSLVPGPGSSSVAGRGFAAELAQSAEIILSHFNRSNFAVEIHQCYLDLVTVGTACLMFEEAPPGDPSAFRFAAVPLGQVALEEGSQGRLDTTFRRSELTRLQLLERFPRASEISFLKERTQSRQDQRIPILEAVVADRSGYAYVAFADSGDLQGWNLEPLAEGWFASTPFINFRWLKAPGEIYGRSPVMKALPDIKTANKVVELVLKNASIAVAGIWQADDDGVINPANIKLVPGTIIPKAVGSAGLTPLHAPGRFDVSEIVLEQVRSRIRKSLYVDQLGQVKGPRMTATEVLERTAEMTRILGATFGRIQSELLTPLLRRAIAILHRRGEIAETALDRGIACIEYRSPQVQYQAQRDAQNTMLWLNVVNELGPDGAAVVDQAAAARWLARAFGVPPELVRSPEEGVLKPFPPQVDPALGSLTHTEAMRRYDAT